MIKRLFLFLTLLVTVILLAGFIAIELRPVTAQRDAPFSPEAVPPSNDKTETEENGGFWFHQPSGTTVDLHGIHFVDTNLGWAVGDKGTIVASSDGGKSWSPQSSGVTVNLSDVYFIDGNTGWVIGGSGTILHTSDGGITWSMQSSNLPNTLYGLDFVDALHGWAISHDVLFYTENGGITWNTQSLPESVRFPNGLDFWDQHNGWVTDLDNGVFATTDGGTTWVQQSTNGVDYIRGIDFISATEGWAVGSRNQEACSEGTSSSVLFHTVDAGNTWTEVDSVLCGFPKAIDFIDAKNGILLSGGNSQYKIVATTNGGIEWAEQHTDYNYLSDLHMLDAQNGWAVGDNGTILRYIEDETASIVSGHVSNWLGLSLRDVTISSSAGHHVAIDSNGYYTMTGFMTGTYTITATKNGYVFEPESYTVNVPPDATQLNFAGREGTYSISGTVTDSSGKPIFDASIKAGEGLIATTDSNGEYTISGLFIDRYTLSVSKSGYHIFSPSLRLVRIQGSDVTGQDFIAYQPSEGFWSPQSSDTTFRAIHFVNANLGWAVGYDGTIVATSDGGHSWSTQYSDATVWWLNDVYFLDENRGWAVGAFGTILHTSDGGTTWSIQGESSSENLSTVYFVDALHGWITSYGTILYTDNGGMTWNTQGLPPSAYSLLALEFWDKHHGWVVDGSGRVLATTDGGATWVEQMTKNADISQIDFISAAEGWAAGYRYEGTCSAGTSWRVLVVFHTTDGGNTWTEIGDDSCGTIYQIDFVDATNGWQRVSDNLQDHILVSSDGGHSWREQHSTFDSLRGFHMLDAQHGWAVGGNSTILHYISESATIFGNVIDTEGEPLPDVTISTGAGHAVESDRRGDYMLGGLLTGTYSISATLPGYTFEPLSVTVSVPPDITGQDFVGTLLTYAISGQISDRSGNPLSDVTVSAGMGVSATTDKLGHYTIPDLAPGGYTLIPVKEGYTFEPPSRQVTLPDADLMGQDFISTGTPQAGDSPPSPPSNQPLIENVQACIGGPFYFDSSDSVLNSYAATIDWQGLTAQEVNFILNEQSDSVSTNGPTAAYGFDLEQLNYLEEGARNSIQIQATSADGTTSARSSLIIMGIEPPSWLSFDELDIPPACLGQPMTAQATLVSEPALSATVMPPDHLPFIGGQAISLQAQASSEIELSGDGAGVIELKGPSHLELAGQSIIGQVNGKGKAGVRGGIYLDEVSFTVDITGSVPIRDNIIDVVCSKQTSCPEIAESESLFANIMDPFFAMAELSANFKPRFDMTFMLDTQSGDPQWQNRTEEGQIESMLAQNFEMIDGLSASAYGGGQSRIMVEVPGDALRITSDLYSAVNLNVWGWQKTFSTSHTWYSPLQQHATIRSSTTDWRLMPRTDGTKHTSNAFLHTNTQHSVSENLVALNVFPQSHPVIATDNQSLMLWVDEDVNQPQTQSQEIYYSVYEDGNWSTLDRITTDNLQDFAPQIAFHANGSAVAVWERNKTVQSQTSQFNAEYANAFELAYSVWNGTSWSEPILLTDNEMLDHAPVLVRGGDGNLLLVWRQNAAGALVGTTSAPDTIYYSSWNGIEWDNPEPLRSEASGILNITAARHDADKMSVVYAQDTDGDLSTANELELFATNWDGSTWSTPSQLTDDNQPDYNANFFYDSDGAPQLLWVKDHTLHALLGSLTDTPQVIASSASINDYSAAQDASNNLAVLWSDYSEEGVDLFYTMYDQQHETFSPVQQLTHDESLERATTPTFAPTGEMLMVYNKTALISDTMIVSSTRTIDNVTTFGNTDLAFMSHFFAPDLTVSEMTVMPANPVPGSTSFVNITVRNKGDRALINPFVTLYLGNPADGGQAIGSSSAKVTLASGMTSTLAVNFPVPTSGGPFALYAVADPNQQINEQDESNNSAHLLLSLPDLLLDDLDVRYNRTETISLSVAISNTGVVASEPFTVNFRLDDPYTGTLIATANATSLNAGASHDIEAIWDSTLYAAGRYNVYALADGDEMIIEADESNNRDWASVAILPELSLRPTASLIGTNPDGSLLVSVWVFNAGGRQANDATIALYDQLPTPFMTPLVSTTISVPAGGHQVATLELAEYPDSGLYAGVMIGEPDRDLSNNVLLIGEAKYPIYLPILLR